MKRIASFLAAFAVLLLGISPVLAAIPPIPPPASSKIVGPAPLALRQVATNSSVPTYKDTSPASFLCRSQAYLTDNVSAIQVENPNFMIDTTAGFAEVGPPGSATVDFADWIEWPKGTFRQLTFNSGAATTGTAANGSFVRTDLTSLGITIPKGSWVNIWIRGIGTGNGRVLFTAGSNNSTNHGGDGCIFSGITGSTVPVTGLTFGASNIASTTGFRPSAVLAYTTQKSYFIPGDSRNSVAVGDTRDGGFADIGEINRGLTVNKPTPAAYISYGNSGEGLGSVTTLTAGQRAHMVRLGNEQTDVIIQLGYNDANGGASLATIQGLYGTVKGYFTGPTSFWLTTKPPGSTSTDSWATTVNQTTNANNSIRTSLNDWVRTSPSGYAGYFEVADACESGRNSGLWKATGTAFGWTGDGTHATALCYDFIRDGGYIKVGALDRIKLEALQHVNDNLPDWLTEEKVAA